MGDILQEIDNLTEQVEAIKRGSDRIKQAQSIGTDCAKEILLSCEMIADRMRRYLWRRARS